MTYDPLGRGPKGGPWVCRLALLFSLVAVSAHAQDPVAPLPTTELETGLPATEQIEWGPLNPPLEDPPGQNLYWHDPYQSWASGCQVWSPETLGEMPVWYARADLLALYRDPNSDFIAARLGPAGPVVLSTSDFDAELDAGFRVLVGRALGDWYRIEGLYYGSFDWNDATAIRNTAANAGGGFGNLYSAFSNFGDPVALPGLDSNNFASISMSSSLSNAELNLRRRYCMRPGCYEFSTLVGVRYTQIEDQLSYRAQSSTPGPGTSQSLLDVSAQNDMIGFQLGFLSQFIVTRRWWIDFEAKGILYQNQASQATWFEQTAATGAVTLFRGDDELDCTVWGGDLSLQVNYHFSPALTFSAGYQALFLSGLALGANNVEANTSILSLGPADVVHDAYLTYHGANFGLVFAW